MPDISIKAQYNYQDNRGANEPLKQPLVPLRPIIRQGKDRTQRFAYMISASEALRNPHQEYFNVRLSPEQLNKMRQSSDQVFFIEKNKQGKLQIEMATKQIR